MAKLAMAGLDSGVGAAGVPGRGRLGGGCMGGMHAASAQPATVLPLASCCLAGAANAPGTVAGALLAQWPAVLISNF